MNALAHRERGRVRRGAGGRCSDRRRRGVTVMTAGFLGGVPAAGRPRATSALKSLRSRPFR